MQTFIIPNIQYTTVLYDIDICSSTYIVPTDYIISVNTPNTQIVGQSLMMGCNFTTVRGITSRVDVVWSSDGEEHRKIEGINVSLSLVTSAVYVATYTIPLLSTTDDGRVYQCEVVINTSPPFMATTSTMLDVTGL